MAGKKRGNDPFRSDWSELVALAKKRGQESWKESIVKEGARAHAPTHNTHSLSGQDTHASTEYTHIHTHTRTRLFSSDGTVPAIPVAASVRFGSASWLSGTELWKEIESESWARSRERRAAARDLLEIVVRRAASPWKTFGWFHPSLANPTTTSPSLPAMHTYIYIYKYIYFSFFLLHRERVMPMLLTRSK